MTVAVAIVSRIGVVEDGGAVDTLVAVVVVVEMWGRRGVGVGGAGSSEVEVKGVFKFLVFERKALRLIGAFGVVLKNGRIVLRLGHSPQGTAWPSKSCVPTAAEDT